MPQQLPRDLQQLGAQGLPDDLASLGGELVHDPNSSQQEQSGMGKTIHDLSDRAKQFISNHPIFGKLLNGPMTDGKYPIATGMGGGFLPEMQHNPDESGLSYLGKAAYNNLIQPLSSSSGMLGSVSIPEIPHMPSVKPPLELPPGQYEMPPLNFETFTKPNIPKRTGFEEPQLPTKYFPGREPTYEEAMMNSERAANSSKPIIDVQPVKSEALKVPEKTNLLNEATNLTKSMMASVDVSAPLRQGLPLIHRKEWWTSLNDMFSSLVSEKNYQGLMQSIEEKPTYQLATKSGLSLTSLEQLSQREEAFMSKWAEKIPGVRASERAYVGFLNKLRSDTFDSLLTTAEKAGRDITPELTRSIAKYINTSTGRGSLGSLEKAAVELNYVFFSPRFISSKLTMMNPKYYVDLDPLVRKEALKSLLAIAGAGETVTQLGKMAGGTAENDPRSPDFQKVKFGNTRLDPYGGMQQYIVAATKLLTGQSTSSTTGKTTDMGSSFVAPTRLSTVANFGRSKLSPVASFAADLLAGKDYSGQPISVPKEVVSRLTPMLMQDLYSLWKDDPTLLPLGIGAALGMGMQTYQSK